MSLKIISKERRREIVKNKMINGDFIHTEYAASGIPTLVYKSAYYVAEEQLNEIAKESFV